MRVLLLPGVDPCRNLATEEHLLTTTSDDALLLWRNDRTVVVGRNQNAADEVDADFVAARGIKVVRRISGGGAVYHDLNNVNFSFLTSARDGAGMGRFTGSVAAALRRMGVPAEVDGRNDILAGGRKVSGNAQALVGKRLLHHGTLLLDVDVEAVAGALTPHPGKLRAKGVRSVVARVAGMRRYLPGISAEAFMLRLAAELAPRGMAETYAVRPEEAEAVAALERRYASWEWTYGGNPPFSLRWSSYLPGGMLDVRLDVRKGRVVSVAVGGDFMATRPTDDVCAALVGVPWRRDAVAAVLDRFDLTERFGGIPRDALLDALMFSGVCVSLPSVVSESR